MKYFLLILLLFAVSVNFLMAENIDREKILPKKLIYSELPDDYPKELDELFEFYLDILTEIYNKPSVDYYRERSDELVKILKALPESEFNYYAYLIWLARTSIPEYFTEYETINSPVITKVTFNERNPLSFLSVSIFDKLDRAEDRSPGVLKINIIFRSIMRDKYPEISLIDIYPDWIQGKILESQYIVRYDETGISKSKNYVIVEILDDFSGNFHKKQIMLEIFMNRYITGNKILQTGKIYLIPFANICNNNNYVELPENVNIDIISEFLQYRSSIRRCLEIADDNTMSRVNKAPFYNNHLFTSDIITYTQAKETIQKAMKLYKSFSNYER